MGYMMPTSANPTIKISVKDCNLHWVPNMAEKGDCEYIRAKI